MANLTLDKFECNGEVSSVGTRWERWKRSLYIYLEAANVQTASQKRASLLHWGGSELQEIFYNIPGADALAKDGIDVSKIALDKLDEYFAPKQSKRFERHIFRKMKQLEEEKFEKFVLRLRQQAQKCQFTDVDEQIIDQITESCSLEELRKKILKTGDTMTLDDVITEANALEIVSRQLEEFKQKTKSFQDVNKIDTKVKDKQLEAKRECFRCGSWNHLAFDEKCPAKGKKCMKCERIGHFKLQCKTNPLKRRLESQNFDKNNIDFTGRVKKIGKEVRNINEQNIGKTSDEDVQYVFNIDGDEMVTCIVGGMEVQMLIDSGCKHNLITDKTWMKMKEGYIKVTEQKRNPDKIFLAYGSTVPLKLIGSFRSRIGKEEDTTFYVIEGGERISNKMTVTQVEYLILVINKLHSKNDDRVVC